MSNRLTRATVDALRLLLIAFITLKLTHQIEWSWWWVLAPLWGGFALLLAFFLFALVVAVTMLSR